MNHPYIGLPGTVRVSPYTGDKAGSNDPHGTVVGVCQGGSSTEEGGAAYLAIVILRDVPYADGRMHTECDAYHFVPDDPAEARRRLVAAGATVDYEAFGRGMMREMLEGLSHSPPDVHARRYGAQRLAEIIAKGIGSARGGGS